MGYSELIPECDLALTKESYYVVMHTVMKGLSTTLKMRVVFDPLAKSTSGMSLNDHLLVGPTVHLSLIDVLLLFSANN